MQLLSTAALAWTVVGSAAITIAAYGVFEDAPASFASASVSGWSGC